jgi:hypothetical protein
LGSCLDWIDSVSGLIDSAIIRDVWMLLAEPVSSAI